jgi:hypothetical protein
MLRLVEDEADLPRAVREELATGDAHGGGTYGVQGAPNALATELRDYLQELANPHAA